MHSNNINNQSVKKWRYFTHRNIFTISIWIIRKLGDFSCFSPSKELFLILMIHCNLHLYCRFKFLSTHLSSKEQFHLEKVHKNTLAFFIWIQFFFQFLFLRCSSPGYSFKKYSKSHQERARSCATYSQLSSHKYFLCSHTKQFQKDLWLPTKDRFQVVFGGFHKLF